MFEKYVKCSDMHCQENIDQPHSHHMTRYGTFWWRTWRLHRGWLPASPEVVDGVKGR